MLINPSGAGRASGQCRQVRVPASKGAYRQGRTYRQGRVLAPGTILLVFHRGKPRRSLILTMSLPPPVCWRMLRHILTSLFSYHQLNKARNTYFHGSKLVVVYNELTPVVRDSNILILSTCFNSQSKYQSRTVTLNSPLQGNHNIRQASLPSLLSCSCSVLGLFLRLFVLAVV